MDNEGVSEFDGENVITVSTAAWLVNWRTGQQLTLSWQAWRVFIQDGGLAGNVGITFLVEPRKRGRAVCRYCYARAQSRGLGPLQVPFLGDPPRTLVHAHGLRPHRHATQTLARRVLARSWVVLL
jgi:hypothetical protein